MCGKCDSVEGNLCPACEAEQKDVQKSVDPWWPEMTVKRSINSLTGAMPENFLYV